MLSKNINFKTSSQIVIELLSFVFSTVIQVSFYSVCVLYEVIIWGFLGIFTKKKKNYLLNLKNNV